MEQENRLHQYATLSIFLYFFAFGQLSSPWNVWLKQDNLYFVKINPIETN